MKKIFLFPLCALLLFALAPHTAAVTPQGEQIADAYRGFTDAIPPEITEYLGEDFLSTDAENAESVLREKGGITHILQVGADLTGVHLRESLGLLATICALLLLSSLLEGLQAGRGEGTRAAFRFCSALALACMLLAMQKVSAVLETPRIKSLMLRT